MTKFSFLKNRSLAFCEARDLGIIVNFFFQEEKLHIIEYSQKHQQMKTYTADYYSKNVGRSKYFIIQNVEKQAVSNDILFYEGYNDRFEQPTPCISLKQIKFK